MAVMDYRTQDGLADYGFSIEFYSDAGWRVYPIFQPFHQGYDDSLRSTYQSMDHNGRCYVNWSSKIDSLGDAKTVAALWAELIHRYQRTQKQKRDTPADPDSPGDAVRAAGSGPGHRDRGPGTPRPVLEAACGARRGHRPDRSVRGRTLSDDDPVYRELREG